jgi:hypothetical protein
MIYLLVIIFLIIIIYLYYINTTAITYKKLEIKSVKPIKLKTQEKKLIINPVDVEYYNYLKKVKNDFIDKRKNRYKMKKETINNEIPEINNLNMPNNIIENVIDINGFIILENLNNEIPEANNLNIPNNFIDNIIDNNGNLIPEELNNDNQNVHDSTVQDTIKKKYKKLKEENIKINNNNNINDEILIYGNNIKKLSQNKLKDLDFVLKSIYKRNSSIMNLEDEKEYNILCKLWKKLELREQLINELLDCKINNLEAIVCPSGVCSRLLNADIVLKPESTPRTIEMLRVEMLNTASKIRNELEKENTNYSEEELKKKLKEQYNKDYKEILSEEIIQKELDTWINDI